MSEPPRSLARNPAWVRHSARPNVICITSARVDAAHDDPRLVDPLAPQDRCAPRGGALRQSPSDTARRASFLFAGRPSRHRHGRFAPPASPKTLFTAPGRPQGVGLAQRGLEFGELRSSRTRVRLSFGPIAGGSFSISGHDPMSERQVLTRRVRELEAELIELKRRLAWLSDRTQCECPRCATSPMVDVLVIAANGNS